MLRAGKVRGFTLIEMMVVVSLILILTAISRRSFLLEKPPVDSGAGSRREWGLCPLSGWGGLHRSDSLGH